MDLMQRFYVADSKKVELFPRGTIYGCRRLNSQARPKMSVRLRLPRLDDQHKQPTKHLMYMHRLGYLHIRRCDGDGRAPEERPGADDHKRERRHEMPDESQVRPDNAWTSRS